MPNFDAKVRIDYQDIQGLALDCRQGDIPKISGTHDGIGGVAILSDSTAAFTTGELIGQLVFNDTDGSSGTVTANTPTTVTATLSGGTNNYWSVADAYHITVPNWEWINRAPANKPQTALTQGSHNGPANNAVLIDTGQSWIVNQWVNEVVYNDTDGSLGVITANSATSVTATLLGGAENDWDVSDEYHIATPRFGNPFQSTPSKVPESVIVSGLNALRFTIADQSHLVIPLDDSSIDYKGWNFAVDYATVGSAASDQTLLGFPNLELMAEDSSGDKAYRHGGTTQSDAGAMTAGEWLFLLDGGDVYQNGVSIYSGTDSNQSIDSSATAGYIGSSDGASDFLGGDIRAVQIWGRAVSPLEIDFAFKTLSEETDHSVNGQATMSVQNWTDDTSSTFGPRINPTGNAQHKFIMVKFPAGTQKRVQIAATVDNFVVPDTALGGDLFTLIPIESPTATPHVVSAAGWSAVQDVFIKQEGHYTLLLSRTDGGSIVIHIDAQEL